MCHPTIQRWLLWPSLPIWAGLRPSRIGWINAIPSVSATPSTVGAAMKSGGPRRVRREEPCEAGPLRHVGEQRQRIARQPAIEGAHAAALHRIEQGEGDDFTGDSVASGCLGSQHLLVHGVEQCDNKIWGSHRALHLVEVVQHLQRVPLWLPVKSYFL